LILLAPLVGVLTQRIPAYRMVIFGSFVAASSVFIMTVPPHWFQPLADGWLGHCIAHVWLGVSGTVNPYYVMIFLFVLLLSLGEAFYSPRLYEYTVAIAPNGQEASYMAMSSLPFFLAKLAVGPLSDPLLAQFCPATGPRHSETLWLIIGLKHDGRARGSVCLPALHPRPRGGAGGLRVDLVKSWRQVASEGWFG